MAHTNSLPGEIEVGDTVETLDSKRTITGKVTHIDKRKRANVLGTEYPGGPSVSWTTHVENLSLLSKGEKAR